MVCEVCGSQTAAAVAEPWHFRLNGFVLEGLREHGLLPTIWCLSNFARNANSSFFYLESHELFFTEENANKGKPEAELDLLVVSDGVVHLIEAKASRQGIEVNKTAELAKRLRPNQVTLAVMEEQSPALSRKVTELRELLSNTGIKADVMTLSGHDIDMDPHLPTGTSFRLQL